MTSIQLENVGKRFNREWIFRGINQTLTSENKYVILGRNGSGKSTLLQTLAGKYEPSEGVVDYKLNNAEITVDNIFLNISICTPYLELFEDYTLEESIRLQAKFKSFKKGIELASIPDIMQLDYAKGKQLKYYSSGMKQRVKLGLAILADTNILLLDEPTNNLDQQGFDWYKKVTTENIEDRLVIVCSNNQTHEFEFCNEQLNIENFKN